jgi:hypothetical protein
VLFTGIACFESAESSVELFLIAQCDCLAGSGASVADFRGVELIDPLSDAPGVDGLMSPDPSFVTSGLALDIVIAFTKAAPGVDGLMSPDPSFVMSGLALDIVFAFTKAA